MFIVRIFSSYVYRTEMEGNKLKQTLTTDIRLAHRFSSEKDAIEFINQLDIYNLEVVKIR